MKTKYQISTENTYMGPIASVPDSLFNDSISTQIERTGNDWNNNNDNNPEWKTFTTEHYAFWLESATVGGIRFYAGHQKHTFKTCNRPIMCKLVKGQLKVRCECGSQKWTITEDNNIIDLIPNAKYFVKNNSLRNECIVMFTFGSNR